MSEQNSKLRIHAQITPKPTEPPETDSKPIRWKCIPHPQGKRRPNAPPKEKARLTYGDRLLRNSALSCALLLAILALGNVNQPWAKNTSATIQRALTMHIDLDESIGRLSFVQKLMPESALVFFNISGETELAPPVAGELIHDYSELQPWLMLSCPEGSTVCAVADGTVTAVSDLPDGAKGLLIDHGSGVESVYAYLAKVDVQAGDTVARGQSLGTSLASLYFEWRENELSVDPTERMGLSYAD